MHAPRERRSASENTVTAVQEDFDQTKLSTDLAYSHMAMLTLLPNGSLASLMQAGQASLAAEL